MTISERVKSLCRRALDGILAPLQGELPFFVVNTLLLALCPVAALVVSGGFDFAHSLVWLAFYVGTSVFFSWIGCCLVWLLKPVPLKPVAYLLATLLFVADVFLRLQFSMAISVEALLLIAETTRSEASDFLQNYLLSLKGIASVCLAVAILSVAWLWERAARRQPGRLLRRILCAVVVLSAIPGSYAVVRLAQLPWMETQVEREEWYMDHGYFAVGNNISNLLFACSQIGIVERENRSALEVTRQAAARSAVARYNDSLTVVLIVGESFNKHHSSLYGYRHTTNPELAKEAARGNLVVFADAVAPYNLTTYVMRNLFSINSLSHGEEWFGYPLFPVVFKKAGFKTFFFDNQKEATDGGDYILNNIIYNPVVSQLAYDDCGGPPMSYDGVFVDSCMTGYNPAQHNLVMIHLMGQHSLPQHRYPHQQGYDVMKAADYGYRNLSEAARQYVADYDNATIYNDAVVAKTIDYFRNTPSVVVYLSDHGEEVYDYRNTAGRTHESLKTADALRHQYEVPLMVWMSDKYRERFPQLETAVRNACRRPLTTDNIAHTLFRLASIATPYYNNRYDVISKDYDCGRRVVQGKCDYDEIMKQKQ